MAFGVDVFRSLSFLRPVPFTCPLAKAWRRKILKGLNLWNQFLRQGESVFRDVPSEAPFLFDFLDFKASSVAATSLFRGDWERALLFTQGDSASCFR